MVTRKTARDVKKAVTARGKDLSRRKGLRGKRGGAPGRRNFRPIIGTLTNTKTTEKREWKTTYGTTESAFRLHSHGNKSLMGARGTVTRLGVGPAVAPKIHWEGGVQLLKVNDKIVLTTLQDELWQEGLKDLDGIVRGW